jgi:phosphatidylinositol glycan class U
MTSIRLNPSNRLNLVLVSAFCLRLLLQTQTSLPTLLSSRLEISTPITSFKRCAALCRGLWLMVVKEGLFLYEHGVPPYNGGVCHQVLSPPRRF